MIQVYEDSKTYIVENAIQRKIDKQSFDNTLVQLEAILDEYPSTRGLERIQSVEGFPISDLAIWDDIRFGIRFADRVSHPAVVAHAIQDTKRIPNGYAMIRSCYPISPIIQVQ